ncbi:MAG: hypothetical protein NTZ51_00150 [Proteobacteria bacterium]|nr:hypothetical protein [Pseudomonadota bacterium]
MKKILFEFLFICTLTGAALCLPLSVCAEVERIDKEELNAKLCSPNVLLLDVRTGEVWEKSKIKIKCARRVDPNDVSSWIDTLPRDKEIVLYCCS